MRTILLLTLAMLSDEVLSKGWSVFICLHNTTPSSHHIEVADIDNYDWEGDNRPDHNFNDLTIEPGATICRQEDANVYSKPRFTFVIDNNPTRMAVYGGPTVRDWMWGAYTNPANPTTVYGRTAHWNLSNGWLSGGACADRFPEDCYEFEIRKEPI